MKVTGKPYTTATLPASESETNLFTNGPDLKAIQRATTTVTRLRARNPSLTRQRRSGAPGGRRSRPETPLLKWRVEDRNRERGGVVEDDDYEDDGGNNNQVEREITRRKDRRKTSRPVSVRKLAAGLWRLQVPDAVSSGGERKGKEGLGFQVQFFLFLKFSRSNGFWIYTKELKRVFFICICRICIVIVS